MRTSIVQRLQRAARTGLVAMGLVLGCGWLGCAGEAPDGTRGSEALVATRLRDRPPLPISVVGDRRFPWTPANDLDLVDYLVAHHRQAIAMSEMVLARGARFDVRDLASVVRDTRQAQLDTLIATRVALVGSVDASVPDDPHVRQTLKTMDRLEGGKLDRLYLVEMIALDASGIGPVQRAEVNLLRPELQTIAQDLVDGQAIEIGEMGMMLGTDPLLWLRAPAENGVGPSGDPRVPFTPATEVQLIDYYVSRHLEAIALVDMELDYGSDPVVHDLAKGMKAAMSNELVVMRAARFQLTGSPETPVPITDRDVDVILEVMRTLTSEQLDGLFVDTVLTHHADGTAPALRVLPQVVRTDLKVMLTHIFERQAKEIGELEALRKKP
jgi:uncharacterized protein (DUF305 family)